MRKKLVWPRLGLWLPLALGCLLWACKTQQLPTAPVKSEPLLFIHGIMGGRLEHANGQEAWLTAPQALGWEASELALPLRWKNDSEQARDGIRPVAPLDKVTLIPAVIESQIYTGILREGPRHYAHFEGFGYDWRRSNLENTEQLLQRVRALRDIHQKPVNIVAHSMGGMITLAAMQREPELFRRVFFVGVPFGGGIGFLKDLHLGAKTGLNSQILRPEVLATMPSVYGFFPRQARDDLKSGAQIVDVNFFDPTEWERLKIGPFAYDFAQTSEFKAHFRKALAVGERFRESMFQGALSAEKFQRKASHGGPQVYVVASRHLPTMVQIVQNGPDSVRGWDFKNGRREAGDGRVAYARAFPPGLEYRHFEAQAEHSQMLNDPAILKWIFAQE